MAPASKRPLTPKKRVLPIKCTCEGLYNMIFYNYKKEQTDTHLIHVIMREGKTYKSLRDIVDILNETLEMNLTVRTLTQGTGHYVLQKDRVTANLPCQNTASGYKGTVFVNDVGVHDTLVKYLNASNSTIQNRNNATMENIKKVRINANTLVQMLVKQDTLFQMREGVDPKSIPTEHDIKIGRRTRSTVNKNSNSNPNSSSFGHQVTPIAPKVTGRGSSNDSDLSPLSCLAMLASQANQLPTENGMVIKKKKGHSPYNSEPPLHSSDNRNSEFNSPNSSKSNMYQQQQQQQQQYPVNINNNNNNNNMYPPDQQNYPTQNNNYNDNNNNYNNNNNNNIINNNNYNGNNNYNDNNNSSMQFQPLQPQPYNQSNNMNNNSSNMFQNHVNSNKDRRYNDFRNIENLYDSDQSNQHQNSENMMVDDVIPNPSFRNKNRNSNAGIASNSNKDNNNSNVYKNSLKKENDQQQADQKGGDERKRPRADSENDAFRKSVKTESDEYVANPRINNENSTTSSNSTMPAIRHPNDSPLNVTKYMDLEPRPMSAPANLERSSINESDSDNVNETNEKKKIGLKKSNLEKSLSQSNSPISKKTKGVSKANKRKNNKSKSLDNKKKGAVTKHSKDIENDDFVDENNLKSESIKN